MHFDENEIETHYRLALEAGGIGLCVWSAASDLLACDERARGVLGCPPDVEVTLALLCQRIHPADLAAVRESWQRAIDPAGDRLLRTEFRIGHPDGGRARWITAFGKSLDTAGAGARMVVALRDISPKRWASDDVARSEARLAGILSVAIDAIISVDAAGRITLFNNGAETIFGWTREEMLGRPLELLLPERFRAGHGAHMRAFAVSGETARSMGARQAICGLHRDGREFPAEASISVLEIDGERTYSVVLRDITERRRAHEELTRSYGELERRVAERTRELSAEMQRREQAQAQLMWTQRMEAFGQLTGGIAHDFNNLLTVVTGNLEILEMRLKDPRDRTLLRRAAEAAEMGARLTGRLLTFARRRTYEIAPLDLNEQVLGLVDLLRRTLGEPIDLSTRLAPRLWTVRADPSEIENAILNLAINARDAMPKGGRLVIETSNVTLGGEEAGGEPARRLPAGDYVCLSVTDTGVGMPPEVAGRAFEPFFTTKQPGRGTGLGLSTIYGFVQELGGTVALASEPGHGTTVTLYLPRTASDARPARSGASEDVPSAAGETVLLVEDNPEVREVTRVRLEDLGYQVLEAENGPAALLLLQSDRVIDIVFTDVVMAGGMSGYDVARSAAQLRPGIRILLTTGYAEEVQRAQEQDGAAAALRVLAKPYDRGELARAIRRTLDS